MVSTIDKKTYVIGLGGSIIAPSYGEFQHKYIAKFREVLKTHIKKHDSRFVVIVGGGKTARNFQQQLKDYYQGLTNVNEEPSKDSLDWMGIQSTRINAQFLKEAFGFWAHPTVYSDLDDKQPNFDRVLFGGGWKPGRSTDYCAMQHVVNLGADAVINLSNTSHIYDKDPNQFEDAKPYKSISWSDYREQVGDNWEPGANAPFDPVASKLGHINDKKVKIIASDSELRNLEAALHSDNFDGTMLGTQETIFK